MRNLKFLSSNKLKLIPLVSLLVVALLAPMIGCSDNPTSGGILNPDPGDSQNDVNGPGDGSRQLEDCGAGFTCDKGSSCFRPTNKCKVEECQTSDQCPDKKDRCLSGLCISIADQCSYINCDPGFKCEDGACLPDCTTTCNGICCKDSEVCFDNKCVAPCPAGNTLCSVDPNGDPICCSSAQSCAAGKCVTAGDSCNLENEDYCLYTSYCNQNGTKEDGVCVRYSDVGDTLCRTPALNNFNLVEVLHWPPQRPAGHPLNPYNQVMATPAVADIMKDGTSDIVFSAWNMGGSLTRSYEGKAVLFVIDGKAGPGGMNDVIEHWNSQDLGSDSFFTRSSEVAIGDLDNDGDIEIVAPLYPKGLIAINGRTKKVLWDTSKNSKKSEIPNYWLAIPVIADLDHDGNPEVITNFGVMNGQTGEYLCEFNEQISRVPSVANLDDDDNLEIVGGVNNYKFNRADDGSVTCNKYGDFSELKRYVESKGSYVTAVADVLKDKPGPEIVVSSSCRLVVMSPTGEIYRKTKFPDFSSCSSFFNGVPTIADFDGASDNQVEIAVAGPTQYVVYSVPSASDTLVPIWSYSTQDHSSGYTGSSVFDFNGDGAADAVYNDHNYLYVFKGKRVKPFHVGTMVGDEQLLVKIPNSNRTLYEYPVIADVNNDGSADIVVTTNQFAPPATHGLRVFSEQNNKFVSTRTIWNQHAYQPTLIKEDGSVPTSNPKWWEKEWSNNFRQNPQTNNPGLAADLVPEFMGVVPKTGCGIDATEFKIKFRLRNDGDKLLPAGRVACRVSISKDNGATWELVSNEVKNKNDLLARDSVDLEVDWRVGSVDDVSSPFRVKIEADFDEKVIECNEQNNNTEVENVVVAQSDLSVVVSSVEDAVCTPTSGLDVKLEIYNQGKPIPANSGVSVSIYVGVEGDMTEHKFEITEKIEQKLEKTINVKVKDTLTFKPLTVYAVIDSEKRVSECDEQNNRGAYNYKPICYNFG